MADIFLTGPTASGKSALAFELAGEFGAHIYALDAFQVYRHMDIGTAKPSSQERATIPHEMIDLVDPDCAFNVADYLAVAEKKKASTVSGHRIWVGGAGLYYRALTKGLSDAPASDPVISRRYEDMPLDELREMALRLDPVWSGKSDLSNKRRLTRALTVMEMTGKTMSSFHESGGRGTVGADAVFFLEPEKCYLKHKIAARARKMLEEGWIEEVRKLEKAYAGWMRSTAGRAIGYASIRQMIEGKKSRSEVEEEIIRDTCHYAKRQLTWFKKESNVEYIRIHDDHGIQTAQQYIRDRIVATLQDGSP